MLSLDELKALVHFKPRKDFLSCSAIPSGLPRGAITEISGFGKTELVTKFISEHADLRVAWIEESFSVFPFGFLQRNIDLDRVLFIEAGEDLAWAALQVLKAQIFGVVVLYTESMDISTLRRLQLASEKSHATTLWLTSHPQSLWPVNLQLQVRKTPEQLEVTTLRQRY